MNNVAVVSMEILVTGVTACVWIALLAVRIIFPESEVISVLKQLLMDMSMGNLLIASIMMYNIGWVIHHLSERILDSVFQTRYRRSLFADEDFYKIRAVVFQMGSQNTMDDIKFDRHVLRISRSNVLNFTILTIVCALYIPIKPAYFWAATFASAFVTVLSALQWVARYHSTYPKFKKIYDAIMEKEQPNNDCGKKKKERGA